MNTTTTMKTLIATLLIIMLFGCAKVGHEHDPALVGTWEPYYLTLEDANAEPDSGASMHEVFMATPNNWEKVTGIKPIRVTYASDGTFTREHRDRNDSLFLRSSGTWYTAGDSLYWFQDRPDTSRLILHYSMVQDTLRTSGIVDFDRDGRKNDKMMEFLKKIVEADSTK